jgi:hypothetical protein
MFVFNRSAAAVLLPLALLVAVVLWSGRSGTPAADSARLEPAAQATVAQNAATPRRGE